MTSDTKSKTLKIGMESFDLGASVPNIAEFFAVFDTGLQPTSQSGVILHRVGLGSEQIVYQYAPGFRSVGYKQHEGDPDDKMAKFNLAFPYWIVCISYERGVFQGVRHFYSPIPIYSLTQPLYVPNLPNTNTRGYPSFTAGGPPSKRATSVGWVCLYHHTHETFTDLNAKVNYALSRHDPIGEPYNYGNMKETDGYTTYKTYREDKPFLWNPVEWEKKGEAEGLDWVAQEDLWIPMMVDFTKYKFAERAEFAPAGKELDGKIDKDWTAYSLYNAIYDHHYVYYATRGAEKLIDYTNALILDDKQTSSKIIDEMLRTSIVSGSQKVDSSTNLFGMTPQAPTLGSFVESFPKNAIRAKLGLMETDYCPLCWNESNHAGEPEPTLVLTNSTFIEAMGGAGILPGMMENLRMGSEKLDNVFGLPELAFNQMSGNALTAALRHCLITKVCQECIVRPYVRRALRSILVNAKTVDKNGFDIATVTGVKEKTHLVELRHYIGNSSMVTGSKTPLDHPYRGLKGNTRVLRAFGSSMDRSTFTSTSTVNLASLDHIFFSLRASAGSTFSISRFAEAANMNTCGCGVMYTKDLCKRDWAIYSVPYSKDEEQPYGSFQDIPFGISDSMPEDSDTRIVGCITCTPRHKFNPLTGCLEDTRSATFASNYMDTELPFDKLLNEYKWTKQAWSQFIRAFNL